jgi:putative tricarboxylic transport membrane protein
MRIELSAWFSLGLALFIATILFVGAQSISPPIFDPVGSAALPQACAVALIGGAMGIFIESALRAKKGIEAAVSAPLRPATLGILALMCGYLLAMQFGFGFLLPTIFFTAVAIPIVAKSRKAVPFAIVTALLLGFGCQALFSSVFFVDLPVMK